MIYDALTEEGLDEGVDDGLDSEAGEMDFAPLLEIGDADKFSAVVARLEGAGIPWFVENAGAAAVLYVTMPRIEEARQLAG
jgi:hypothetical protein